jgi:hypothetical protein
MPAPTADSKRKERPFFGAAQCNCERDWNGLAGDWHGWDVCVKILQKRKLFRECICVQLDIRDHKILLQL